MWRHGEGLAAQKRAANAGITEDLLADAFAVHSPMTRAARVPSDRLYVVACKGDRVTPPDHAEALANHLCENGDGLLETMYEATATHTTLAGYKARLCGLFGSGNAKDGEAKELSPIEAAQRALVDIQDQLRQLAD